MSTRSNPKKDKNKKKLVLFDAHAILHRAYHALPDFMSSKGEPTGGLYGLSTMLIRIIGELKPDYMAACYDRPEATFRKEAFDGYKAQRKKADDELIAQMIRSRDIFNAFDIPVYEKAGFEADDVIGTICCQAENLPVDIIIASGDMDTLQLANDKKVQIYTLKKGLSETIMYDEDAVVERFGFGPALLPDYKGLRGDPSDNIPGVAGIGEKTATDLLVNFGSIEDIYAKLKKDEAAFKEAGIKDRIVALLKDNEEEALFSKMLATIKCDVPITFDLPKAEWKDACDMNKIETLFSQLDFRSLLPRTKALLPEVLGEAADKEEEAAPADYDPKQAKRTGIAFWLIDSSKTTPSIEDILDYAKTRDLSVAEKKIMAELKELKLDKVYNDIEAPLIPIIDEAEKRGILIDKKYLAKLSKDYHAELAEIEKKIYQEVGEEFNINSPKQLARVLFDELKISIKGLRKTAGGARSTKESELQKIKDEHAIIPLILKYREYQKLLSTYIDNIPQMTDENDRLHTSLNQAGTTTGRMSSNNPNLQNIPVREGNGSRIRNAFVAEKGHVLLAFDYSQIEMRVLADLADETELIKVFRAGKDVHSSVAAKVFGVPENEVTKDMRRKAKVINFGIIYGMGVNALKGNLGTSREEAQKFYDHFFLTFPKIREYFDNVITGAYKKGYTETQFGRRRYFPELKSQLPYIRAGAERMAMNAPLQGTAADLVKLSIIKAHDELGKKKLLGRAHLLLQIHDELIFEVDEEVKDEAAKIIQEAMESVGEMRVPLIVNWGEGKSWGEIEK
jgi:DNA polymerase-1